MGNKDIHELTNRAVEMELGVGGFGGSIAAILDVAAVPFKIGLS